jgi:hypothetical protein
MQRGIENITRMKQAAYLNAQKQFAPELQQLNFDIRAQDSILASTNAAIQGQRKNYQATTAANVGFLERNKALSDLADEESSVFWTSLLLSLLIILIEVGPILSKLIMPIGPYDIALAKEELTSMAASENDMRKNKELTVEKLRAFYKKQREMSDLLVDKMSSLQQKHIDEELEKWERGEWNPRDHRASMDEVMRKLKERYRFKEEDLL